MAKDIHITLAPPPPPDPSVTRGDMLCVMLSLATEASQLRHFLDVGETFNITTNGIERRATQDDLRRMLVDVEKRALVIFDSLVRGAKRT